MTTDPIGLQGLVMALASKLGEECRRVKVYVNDTLAPGVWRRSCSYCVRATPAGEVWMIETSDDFLPERFDLKRRPAQRGDQPADQAKWPAGLARELITVLTRLLNEVREKEVTRKRKNEEAETIAREALADGSKGDMK